jgi:hypothetical protein
LSKDGGVAAGPACVEAGAGAQAVEHNKGSAIKSKSLEFISKAGKLATEKYKGKAIEPLIHLFIAVPGR